MAIKEQINKLRIRVALWLMPSNVVVRLYDRQTYSQFHEYINRVVAEVTADMDTNWAKENPDSLN